MEQAHRPRPVLLAVDDDADDRAKIEHELYDRYGRSYRIVCEASAEAGMSTLETLRAAGEEVAVALADLWMPKMTGPEFLARARRIFPTAKRALLVTWGDPSVREPIVRSMTLGQIDYYVPKPGRSPDERFHGIIAQLLSEWAQAHRPTREAIRVVGERWSVRSHELRNSCERQSIPHAFYAADSKEGQELLAQLGLESSRLPVVILLNGHVLVDPSDAEIFDATAPKIDPERQVFDVVVVGAGPAGLAAAVYAASEGLSTMVLEGEAIGGQAGTSSLIRNYLGFPRGISGAELAAEAHRQAWLFGANFYLMRHATRLRRRGEELIVTLSDGKEVTGRVVIVATGASYRRLGVSSLEALVGTGVFYGAAVSEAKAMEGQEVYVVGGANSAGQAALHLSKYASRVTLVVRGSSLSASMSSYLIREIETAENIEVRQKTLIVGGGGEGRLERLVLKDSISGRTETVPAAALFVFIGAEPRTGWLPEEMERDEKGFIVTGQDLLLNGQPPQGWPLARPPLPLESSMPGMFAVGDVRHGSVKRVASAVGEGSIAIQLVHDYLTNLKLGISS
jgi:thioredoxin reductase (NADPH)